ncbi:MAG: hypothetical protein IT529_11420 [Burkholderiales bacterium]|nr:hypothetical protein [Burkholderiales bacterium]
MANNFLEQLVAEWYEYRGYLVRRNVAVGRRPRGGHEAELDLVALNPVTRHLVHLEPSMDAESWVTRERRFRRKFDAGRQWIPGLFPGLRLPAEIEQVAILVSASKANHPTLGGGKVLLVADLMREIMEELAEKRSHQSTVPEHHVLLRTLELVVEYRRKVFATLR